MDTIDKYLCNKCDAACCKIFFLPTNYKIKFSIHNPMGFINDVYSKIFCYLFTNRVNGNLLKYIEDTDQNRKNRIALSCIFVKDDRCSIYRLRPFFCSRYFCYGRKQTYHGYLESKGMPLPAFLNKKEEDA